MNKLAFEIMPSPSSNDHQARIRIDGTDWLGQEYLGLDPLRLFAQPSLDRWREGVCWEVRMRMRRM
jgi:hypothetical protein